MKNESTIRVEYILVSEKNIRDIIMKIAREERDKAQIMFRSQTMHQISKDGRCKNYCKGYTKDYGTCMISTEGILLSNKIAYNIYPYDLISELKGVESVITEVYDRRGIVVYKRPESPKKTYVLISDKAK